MDLELTSPVYAEAGRSIYVTQPFGINGAWYRSLGFNIDGHTGVDINSQIGQRIYAAHDGVVLWLGVDSRGAVGINIRTEEKYAYKESEVYYKTGYWHLEKSAVILGQRLKRGDVIAYSGDTGRSTAPHLHFEVKPLKDDFSNLLGDNGYWGAIDPLPFMFKKDMEHIIIGSNQYLRYAPLKIAIAIANPAELDKLRARGLTSQPAPAPQSMLAGYWIIPGVEKLVLADIFNF